MRYEKEVMAGSGGKCRKHIFGSSIGDLLDGTPPLTLVCLRRRGHRGPHAACQPYRDGERLPDFGRYAEARHRVLASPGPARARIPGEGLELTEQYYRAWTPRSGPA